MKFHSWRQVQSELQQMVVFHYWHPKDAWNLQRFLVLFLVWDSYTRKGEIKKKNGNIRHIIFWHMVFFLVDAEERESAVATGSTKALYLLFVWKSFLLHMHIKFVVSFFVFRRLGVKKIREAQRYMYVKKNQTGTTPLAWFSDIRGCSQSLCFSPLEAKGQQMIQHLWESGYYPTCPEINPVL